MSYATVEDIEAVIGKRHYDDMGRVKKIEPGDGVILQPSNDQMQLLYGLADGPVRARLMAQDVKEQLEVLAKAGYVHRAEAKSHPMFGAPCDVVVTYGLSTLGKHVLDAVKMTAGDVEQLIAEAEHWNGCDDEKAPRIITLYAILLRRFILRGNASELHHQAYFALEKFGT